MGSAKEFFAFGRREKWDEAKRSREGGGGGERRERSLCPPSHAPPSTFLFLPIFLAARMRKTPSRGPRSPSTGMLATQSTSILVYRATNQKLISRLILQCNMVVY